MTVTHSSNESIIGRSDINDIEAILAETGMAPELLELEITESMIMQHVDIAAEKAAAMKKLGIKLAIDDFGTGYSSLGYLRDLPVHALKLDKSFVMGMRTNTDDRIIVESTAQMAHALRLELVAEGVETEWDAQFLAAVGYDFAHLRRAYDHAWSRGY